jgi:uncharacterized protein
MKIRRIVLDVDKAIARPSIVELVGHIDGVPGVQAVNLTVTEIDIETVGMSLTVEGDGIDYESLVKAIDQAGAVVNSIDQVATGERLIENVSRTR